MGIDAALTLLIALLNNAAGISALIAKAKSEGRDTLSAEEWGTIIGSDDAARASLVLAIAKAEAEGR